MRLSFEYIRRTVLLASIFVLTGVQVIGTAYAESSVQSKSLGLDLAVEDPIFDLLDQQTKEPKLEWSRLCGVSQNTIVLGYRCRILCRESHYSDGSVRVNCGGGIPIFLPGRCTDECRS